MSFTNLIRGDVKQANYLIGCAYIKSQAFEISFIDGYKTYDELLTNYLKDNFTRSEIGYLKDGFLEIFTAQKKIEKINIKSLEEIKSELYKKYNGKTHLITFDASELSTEKFKNWLDKYSKTKFKGLSNQYTYALEVLNYELLQFKIKLSRFNIEIIIKGENVIFTNTKNINNNDLENPKHENTFNNLEDYYNHYLKTGRFGFIDLRTFKKNQFHEISKRLQDFEKQYFFIFSKLSNIERIQFKNDFCDQLEKLKANQKASKFNEVIQNLIDKVNSFYSTEKQMLNKGTINIEDFKNKYRSDIWDNYEIESQKLLTPELKIKYWHTKIYEYKKDKLNLDPSNNFHLVVEIDMEFKKPKTILGKNFNWFCKNKIELIKNELNYLKIIDEVQPQQDGPKNPDAVKKELHNNIFNGNAFEVFEKYIINKNVSENCKTDLRVLFEFLKADNLLVETIELKHYIKWLNSNFDYNIFELKKINLNTKPNIQRANDYKEYKKPTLKKP